MLEPLTDIETRVLAALVEKSYTTPEYYPMTRNALISACNQKSNREPVVAYSQEVVADALVLLRERGLVRERFGDGRVAKYYHYFAEGYELVAPAEPVLCELMLRGPQTPGELRARVERFTVVLTVAEVEATLDALAGHQPPLVVRLPRRPGSREARYAHLLAGPVAEAGETPALPAGVSPLKRLEEELAALRGEVATLRADVAELRALIA
jgi:uncharacterized protein